MLFYNIKMGLQLLETAVAVASERNEILWFYWFYIIQGAGQDKNCDLKTGTSI